MKKEWLLRIHGWCAMHFGLVARLAIFIIFFYFGVLKLLDTSSATSLALALTERTIGIQYFEPMFMVLAAFECLLGILFLIPRFTYAAVALLIAHMAVVCSPLLLVPDMAWSGFFVPSLEGQYIIKNVVVVALMVGLVAYYVPENTQRR